MELSRMALAAMDSESWCLPLDYLQGHKDGLEWASQLAEANHPETGDWLYDDPIELAKAIRKGQDMPPSQPVADSEPVAYRWNYGGTTIWRLLDTKPGPGSNPRCPRVIEPLYRHAQPALVVLDEVTAEDCPAFVNYDVTEVDEAWARGFNSCRAAMLAAAPQLPGSELATVPGKWIPVSERMPEIGDIVLTAMGGVVNVGEMECSAANCRFFTSVISGRELPATHWMPMPTAPQEVK
ncbi:DUF551 domain-containing protein [Klebsiella pneumoniae]|nr:DUF551 domain-containing protein [Klebsiella pneumoniae]HCF8027218.1 DUF551 domain-containing protein [Klebsiella pneumoniae]